MDVDEFMEKGLLTSDEEEAPPKRTTPSKKAKGKKKQQSKGKQAEEIQKKPTVIEEDGDDDDDDDEDDFGDNGHTPLTGGGRHGDDDDDDDIDSDDDDMDGDESMDMDFEGDGLDEDDEDAEDGGDSKKSKPFGREVTTGMVKGWSALLQKNSLKGLRQVVDALSAAVHHAAEVKTTEKHHYFVENPQVFNSLVRCCLRNVHTVIKHHIPLDEETEAKGKQKPKKKQGPATHPKWSSIRKTVKSYIATVLLMLQHLHQATLTCAVLRQLQHLLPFISCFPRFLRLLTKRLTSLWSTGDEFVRVLAFLALRRLVIANSNATYRENCFKQMYLAFARNSAFTSIASLPTIQFMENSLAEIYSIDLPLTYQHSFVYIRQLAVHLRKAMTEKSKANIQAVYNWQFVHSLCLWCRVLADCFCSTLEPLVFPLVQVAMGTVQLLPTARYFPLRFHCLRSLIQLSKKTDLYIPVSTQLLDVLDSSSVHCRTKGSMGKPPNFSVVLKVSKSALQTRAYQDGLVDNVFELLLDHLASYSHHIAFPELVLPVLVKLKNFCKKTKVPKFQQQMQQLVSKVDETSKAITAARSLVSFSPKDAKEVAMWMASRRQDKSPILKFHHSWKEMKSRG